MNNDERSAFEARFPVPKWIEWREECGEYDTVIGIFDPHTLFVYNARWETWRASRLSRPPLTDEEISRHLCFVQDLQRALTLFSRKAWYARGNVAEVECRELKLADVTRLAAEWLPKLNALREFIAADRART